MALLLLQMSIVLLVAVVCGRLVRMLGQARVVGEIAGGILIGPSVFGRFAPHLSADLFPQSSLAQLELLSTVGLVLFLFLIGMELDYKQLSHQRGTAMAASGASILLPFGMAAIVANSIRPPWDWQHSVCALSGDCDEHHRFSGACSHFGGTQPARVAARNDGNPVRRGQRCGGMVPACDRPGADW